MPSLKKLSPRNPSSLASAKYLLSVSAGPSYDETQHHPVSVNSSTPTAFENEHIKCLLNVRIRNYNGLPLSAPSSSTYFDHPTRSNDQYSISFTFVPKKDIPVDSAVWGNDFDHPVRDRLPPLFNVAVRIVKELIDPSIELDAYADEPWLLAPALSSFFAWRIGDKKDIDEWGPPDRLPYVEEEQPLQEGADGSGADVRSKHSIPETADKRRRFFRKQENAAGFVFEAGRLYQGDFFNPYIDFGTGSLRLPGGFSINCLKYVNDKTHKLRYVFKDRESGELYFCVVLTLLFGEELEKAVEVEKERWRLAEEEVSREGSSASGETGESEDGASGKVQKKYVEQKVGEEGVIAVD